MLRILSLRGDFGATDSDEAIWTLMSRHVLDGEFPAYFWGQGYGGTIEVYLATPFVWAFGGGVGAARAVALLLTCVATTLVWVVGRRVLDVRRASVAAALFWVWPAYGVWKSTRFNGFYVSGQILGLLVILLVLRLAEKPGRRDAAVLGLVLGLAAWQTWQLVPIVVPALLWLVWRRPGVLRMTRSVLLGLVIGAIPRSRPTSGTTAGRASLRPVAGRIAHGLQGFFTATLPEQLGLRVPFTLDWIVPRPLAGLVLLAAVVGALVLGWQHRATPVGLLVVVAIGFPLLYALSPYTWYVDEPRYLLVLAPVVALLVAEPLRRPRVAATALVVAIGLSIAGFATMDSNGAFARRNGDVAAVAQIAPLVRALDKRGIRTAYGEFWLAYRVTLASGERIIVVPRGDAHYPPHLHKVEGSAFPAYVFYAGSATETEARVAELESLGYRRQVVGGYAIWRRPAEGAGP